MEPSLWASIWRLLVSFNALLDQLLRIAVILAGGYVILRWILWKLGVCLPPFPPA